MTQHQTWDVTSGPGLTALGLAASRTVESARPDRLIDDPWGAAFIAAVDSPVAFPTRWPADDETPTDQHALHLHGSRYIGVRSRFYDDFLLEAALKGTSQVVLLAAGLDTRAFRLPWPDGVTVFEVDQPGVIAFKDDVLRGEGAQAACRRVTVGADLREDWQILLGAEGFDAIAPTAWVAEGLLAYLPPDAEERLLRSIQELSAPDSVIAADHILAADRLAGADSTALTELSERSGVDMKSMIDTRARRGCADWLRDHGWIVQQSDATEIAHRYGRDLSDPFGRQDTPPWLDTGFVTGRFPPA